MVRLPTGNMMKYCRLEQTTNTPALIYVYIYIITFTFQLDAWEVFALSGLLDKP